MYYTLLLRNPLNRLVLALAIGAGAGLVAGAGFTLSPMLAPDDVPPPVKLWAGCVVPSLFFVTALLMVNHRNGKQFAFKQFWRWGVGLSVLWGMYALAAPLLALAAIGTFGLAMILPLWGLLLASSYGVRRVWGIPKAQRGGQSDLLLLALSTLATALSIGVLLSSNRILGISGDAGLQASGFILFVLNYPLLIGGITALLLRPRDPDDAPSSEYL